jgi:hypothetical protein
MGVSPSRAGDPFDIQTVAQLPSPDDYALVQSLPVRGRILDVKHTGASTSSLSNRSGPAVRWRAEFQGTVRQLKVDGKIVPAGHATLPGGRAVSWVTVTVRPGATVVVNKMDK